MKRRKVPIQPMPNDRLAGIGRGVLWMNALVTPLAFSRSTIDGFEFVKFLVLLTTVLSLLVLAILAGRRVTWSWLKRELCQPLTAAGLFAVVAALMSTITSVSPHTSFYGHHHHFAGFLTILAFYILYLATRWLIRTPEEMRHLMSAVVVAVGVATIYGLLQVARLDPFEWRDPSRVGDVIRPFATLGHANFLGAFLVLVLPLVAWRVASGRRPWVALLPVLPLAILALLTLSRGAWLGLATVGIFFAFSRRRGFVVPAVCVLVLLALAAIFFPGIAVRVRGFLDSAGRFEIWSTAWTIFGQYPLAGCGPDAFHLVYGRFGGIDYWKIGWGETPARAHQEILHVLATQGLIGLTALTAGFVALAMTFRRAWSNESNRSLLLAIACGLAGFFVTEMFSFMVIACGSLVAMLLAMVSNLAQPVVAIAVVPGRPCLRIRWIPQVAGIVGVAVLFLQLVLDPWRAECCSQEAELSATNRPIEALALHDEAVRLCPREPLYWRRLALHREALAGYEVDAGRRQILFERAVIGFQETLKRDRDDADSWAGLGRVKMELTMSTTIPREEIERAFDQALQLDPANAATYVSACQAAFLFADAERAKRFLDAGLRLYPRFGPLHVEAAKYEMLLNRPQKAFEAFELAFKADWSRAPGGRERLQTLHDAFERRMNQLNVVAARKP